MAFVSGGRRASSAGSILRSRLNPTQFCEDFDALDESFFPTSGGDGPHVDDLLEPIVKQDIEGYLDSSLLLEQLLWEVANLPSDPNVSSD